MEAVKLKDPFRDQKETELSHKISCLGLRLALNYYDKNWFLCFGKVFMYTRCGLLTFKELMELENKKDHIWRLFRARGSKFILTLKE